MKKTFRMNIPDVEKMKTPEQFLNHEYVKEMCDLHCGDDIDGITVHSKVFAVQIKVNKTVVVCKEDREKKDWAGPIKVIKNLKMIKGYVQKACILSGVVSFAAMLILAVSGVIMLDVILFLMTVCMSSACVGILSVDEKTRKKWIGGGNKMGNKKKRGRRKKKRDSNRNKGNAWF